MTVKILLKDQIRAQVLKILSGYCFWERFPSEPNIYILSPWISNVQLEIDREVLELDELWFGLDYGIRSINLPYALLLLKLDFGANIYIVTLPPNRRNYSDGVPWVRNLLDFLDEVGCEVLINPNIHSKLLFSNDLALLGSFNLSKSALYDREEIGVSIDDIGNLKVLEQYAKSIVRSSTPYGYTVRAYRELGRLPINAKVTRGWFYEEVVKERFGLSFPKRGRGRGAPGLFDEFLIDDIINTKEIYYLDDVVKEVASDLEAFYVKAIITYMRFSSEKEILAWLRGRFDYQGKYEIGGVLDFLKSKLAREHIPKLPIRVFSAKKPEP